MDHSTLVVQADRTRDDTGWITDSVSLAVIIDCDASRSCAGCSASAIRVSIAGIQSTNEYERQALRNIRSISPTSTP